MYDLFVVIVDDVAAAVDDDVDCNVEDNVVVAAVDNDEDNNDDVAKNVNFAYWYYDEIVVSVRMKKI